MGFDIVGYIFVWTGESAMQRANSEYDGSVDVLHTFPMPGRWDVKINGLAPGKRIGLDRKFFRDVAGIGKYVGVAIDNHILIRNFWTHPNQVLHFLEFNLQPQPMAGRN